MENRKFATPWVRGEVSKLNNKEIKKRDTELEAQFKNEWLKFFSTLNWKEVLKSEGKISNGTGKAYALNGSYVELTRFQNGKQLLKIDGKEVKSNSFVSMYGGPSASGKQMERSQIYEDTKRVSGTLASLSIAGDEDDLAASRAFLKVLTNGKGPLQEFKMVHKHASQQAPAEWELLCSKFNRQIEARAHVIRKVFRDEKAKDEMLGSLKENNYYNFERKTMEKQLIKVMVNEGYRPRPMKEVKHERVRSIISQLNLLDVAEKLTKQKPRWVAPQEGSNERGYYEIPCPFSEPKDNHTLTLNKVGFSSSNTTLTFESRNVLGFIERFENMSKSETIKYAAELIAQPIKDEDYVQSKDQCYEKGKNKLTVHYLEDLDTFKFNKIKAKDEPSVFGRIFEFLEFEKGLDTTQAQEYITSFIDQRWLPEEKQAYAEQSRNLPGATEASTMDGSLLSKFKDSISNSQDEDLTQQLSRDAKQLGVEADFTAPPQGLTNQAEKEIESEMK